MVIIVNLFLGLMPSKVMGVKILFHVGLTNLPRRTGDVSKNNVASRKQTIPHRKPRDFQVRILIINNKIYSFPF